MIQVYGQGQPGDLVRPIFHHAQGVRDVALAVLAGLWAHELHSDPDRRHELHFGKGANGVNLHLDTGESFAFRGGFSDKGAYDHVRVHRGSVRPLGPVALELRETADTEALWTLLSDALQTNEAVAA
jgi:hypothetical protein